MLKTQVNSVNFTINILNNDSNQ